MNEWQSEQPAYISASAETTFTREQSFIRTTYSWMFGGLLLTALASFFVYKTPALHSVIFQPFAAIALMLTTLGLVAFLSFRITKIQPGTAAALFLIYAALNGLMLSSIFMVYSGGTILSAFVVAGGMFGSMAVYGTVTKKDLTSWGSFFFMGLIGIILAQVVNFFVKSSALDGTIALVGVFVFVGLTAYDAQKLKAYAAVAGPNVTNYAVIGALALYLDFINMFLMLLRLFGRRD
ncbi:MAG: Bax inhibitor-1/YccA family protein [Thermoanaerobaculia bacterium]